MSHYSHSLRLAHPRVLLLFSGSWALSALRVWHSLKVGHHLLAGSSNGTFMSPGTISVSGTAPKLLIYEASVAEGWRTEFGALVLVGYLMLTPNPRKLSSEGLKLELCFMEHVLSLRAMHS